MMGTYASVLATKKIRTHTDRYRADVEGDVEDVNGTLKITTIRVHYTLKIHPDEKQDALEAFEDYINLCPAAQSVINCIRIEHDLSCVAG